MAIAVEKSSSAQAQAGRRSFSPEKRFNSLLRATLTRPSGVSGSAVRDRDPPKREFSPKK
jgi:hypothetical protein